MPRLALAENMSYPGDDTWNFFACTELSEDPFPKPRSINGDWYVYLHGPLGQMIFMISHHRKLTWQRKKQPFEDVSPTKTCIFSS